MTSHHINAWQKKTSWLSIRCYCIAWFIHSLDAWLVCVCVLYLLVQLLLSLHPTWPGTHSDVSSVQHCTPHSRPTLVGAEQHGHSYHLSGFTGCVPTRDIGVSTPLVVVFVLSESAADRHSGPSGVCAHGVSASAGCAGWWWVGYSVALVGELGPHCRALYVCPGMSISPACHSS